MVLQLFKKRSCLTGFSMIPSKGLFSQGAQLPLKGDCTAIVLLRRAGVRQIGKDGQRLRMLLAQRLTAKSVDLLFKYPLPLIVTQISLKTGKIALSGQRLRVRPSKNPASLQVHLLQKLLCPLMVFQASLG